MPGPDEKSETPLTGTGRACLPGHVGLRVRAQCAILVASGIEGPLDVVDLETATDQSMKGLLRICNVPVMVNSAGGVGGAIAVNISAGKDDCSGVTATGLCEIAVARTIGCGVVCAPALRGVHFGCIDDVTAEAAVGRYAIGRVASYGHVIEIPVDVVVVVPASFGTALSRPARGGLVKALDQRILYVDQRHRIECCVVAAVIAVVGDFHQLAIGSGVLTIRGIKGFLASVGS